MPGRPTTRSSARSRPASAAADRSRRPQAEGGPMSNLVYSAIASLDGYVVDADGSFEWAAPDADLHAGRQRGRAPDRDLPLRPPDVRGALRLGDDRRRRAGHPRLRADLARRDKVVYSTHPRPGHHGPDPAGAAVRPGRGPPAGRRGRARRVRGRRRPSRRTPCGPASSTSCTSTCTRCVVGGGTPALPDGVRLDLRLRSERRFAGGAVHLAYDVRREAGPHG